MDLSTHAAILLAGGASTRTGALGPKGLIEVGGEPWIRRQVAALTGAGLHVVVVTGAHHDAYGAALAGSGAAIVRNPAPERGPFSSLQAGIAALATARQPPAGVVVLPLDVPAPARGLLAALAAATEDRGAAVPEHGGRGGHPVCLSWALARALLEVAEGPNARLDRQLRRVAAAGRLRRVPTTDARVRLDLDTEAEWASFLAEQRAFPRIR